MQNDADPDRTSRMEDGIAGLQAQARASQAAAISGAEPPSEYNYLLMLKTARPRLTQYFQEHLAAPMDASYRAFRNKHFNGSKYWHNEYRNRSKLFRPKTRTAVRKSDAAAVAALFASKDAIKCSPGNESDPMQLANAKLIEALFQYRTDRTSGMAAMPWFRICAGAHQDGMITSACISKQYWKLDLRRAGTQDQTDEDGEPVLDETGQPSQAEVWEPFIDRPDCMLFPLENIEIDPAAHWLNPIQSAAVFVAKVPMSIDEVVQMQEHPLNPWHKVEPSVLRGVASTGDQASRSARQSREGGNDRLDPRYTGTGDFEIVWVYEVFMRVGGRDITFWSAQDRAYLTDPKPVEEVYPEQGGERPYTFGVINLESHRLFPMAPVESWQQSQIEINDFANLMLDTAKLGVSPVKKVVRGKQIDLAQLNRLGPNAQFLVEAPDDVTWDKPPEVSTAAFSIMERLNNDFDTSAGNFDQSTVQSSRYTGETVGGLQLIAGSANAVTEFDQRVWIETWVEPTVAQIVRCIQWYEQDETILGICGERAKLLQRFKVSEITDHLLMKQVTVSVDAGVGNADPMQKLQKLGGAINLIAPLFKDNPKVASGEVVIDLKEIADEAFSLAGYRDGAERFVKVGQPQPNPGADLNAAKIQAETERAKKQGSAAMITALAAAAKVDLTDKQLEQQRANDEIDQHMRATEIGHGHGLALRQHADGQANTAADRQQSQDQFEASQAAAAAEPDADEGGAPAPAPAPAPAEPDLGDQQQGGGATVLIQQLLAMLSQPRRQHVVRGPDGRITDIMQMPAGQAPPPQAAPQPQQPAGPPPGGLVV